MKAAYIKLKYKRIGGISWKFDKIYEYLKWLLDRNRFNEFVAIVGKEQFPKNVYFIKLQFLNVLIKRNVLKFTFKGNSVTL